MSTAYESALTEHGLEDVQPRYRRLLVDLKGADADAYERAVERYRSDVESVLDDASVLDAWVAYGAWLAHELAPGKLVWIDENGRARPVEGTVPLGTLLMQIPSEARQKAVVVTLPREPSDAQRETAALLGG